MKDASQKSMLALLVVFLLIRMYLRDQSQHKQIPSRSYDYSSRSTEGRVSTRKSSSHSSDKQCYRLLVGIFTTMRPADVEIQNERRKYTKFHNLNKPLGCGINYVFVVGNDTAAEKENLHDDTVMVPIYDNVNYGKSFTWLKFAFSRFPDADYIFKVDSDVQICTPFLEKTMLKAAANNQNYFGKKLDWEMCGRAEHCPPEDGNQWYYMSGGFYGLSTSVIARILESGYAEANHVGHEDVWVGRWVYAAAPETVPYNFDCLSTHRHCPAYHWNVRKNYTRYDESLCDVLMTGQPLPWAEFDYH